MVNRTQGIGNQGSLQLPFLLALSFAALGGLGAWGNLRHARFLMEMQLRLDQCVGSAALKFRDHLDTLEVANLEIQRLRRELTAAQETPNSLLDLESELRTRVVQQEEVLAQWRARQTRWLAEGGCGLPQDGASPLPGLPFVRDPDDGIGPQALTWIGTPGAAFDFQVWNLPRAAAARVEGGCSEVGVGCKKWQASWIPPSRLWPSIH